MKKISKKINDWNTKAVLIVTIIVLLGAIYKMLELAGIPCVIGCG